MSDSINLNDVNAGNVNFGTQNFNGAVYIYYGRMDEPAPPRRVRVFLSYARADDGDNYDDPDKSLMRRLFTDLTAKDFAVWWDRESMPSRSLPFSQEIETAILECERFVLVGGPHAAASEWVQAELRCAFEQCKPITVILRAGDYECIPAQLRDVSAIDFRPPRAHGDALDDLVNRLRQDAPIGRPIGVRPLPKFYLERPVHFKAALDAICADSIATTVISAPSRAVALYGYGGIGKSTLAAALAHDCMVRRIYYDGVLWLEVGQHSTPTALQAALGATVFGDSRENYTNEQDGRLALSRLLHAKKALIVLDDVWDHHVVEHIPVEGTPCRLLITTRSGGLARQVEGADIRLDLLTLEEGAALIAKRAGGSADDPIYRQIAATLGGHTLAIALAAAQLGSGYADNAADLLRLLTKRDNPFAHLALSEDDKNENLELSLAQSYTVLKPDLQRCFRATGVLALEGTFDRSMLAVVWGDTDEDESRMPLKTLLDANLLEEAGEGRYNQHRLLHAYARALLVEAGELDETFGRYADYVIEQAAQFETVPLEEWGQLEPLLPHVHEVGDSLADQWDATASPDDALVKRARLFSYNMTDYVGNRPQMVETVEGRERLGLRWLKLGLAVSNHTGDQQREALFYNQIGMVWSDLGEKRKALEYYEQALPLHRAASDQRGEATSLSNAGMAWSSLGEKQIALEYFEQALQLQRDVGDLSGEAITLNNIGAARDDLGEKRKALEYYEQALPSLRTLSDRRGEAITLNNIGSAWSDLGETRKALNYYEQALPLLRAVGDRRGEAVTLNNIGSALDELDQKRTALEYYEQALPLFRAVGDRSSEATMLNNIASTWDDMGEQRKALDYYEQTLALRRVVGDRRGEAVTLNNIASAWSDLGEHQRALDYLEQALQLRRVTGDRSGEAVTLGNIGYVWSQLGEKQKALEYHKQALILRQEVGDRSGEAITCFNIGMIYTSLGDLDRAIQYVERSVQIDTELERPDLGSDRQALERLRSQRDKQLKKSVKGDEDDE